MSEFDHQAVNDVHQLVDVVRRIRSTLDDNISEGSKIARVGVIAYDTPPLDHISTSVTAVAYSASKAPELYDEIHMLRNQRNFAEQRVKNQNQRIAGKKAVIADALGLEGSQRGSWKAMANAIGDLRISLNDVRQEQERTQGQVKDLENQRDQLASDRATLNNSAVHWQNKHDELLQRFNYLAAENERLQRELADAEQRKTGNSAGYWQARCEEAEKNRDLYKEAYATRSQHFAQLAKQYEKVNQERNNAEIAIEYILTAVANNLSDDQFERLLDDSAVGGENGKETDDGN